MQTLQVQTPSKQYSIHIGEDLLAQPALLAPHLASGQVAIVTNTTIAPLYLPTLRASLAQLNIVPIEIILPDGEQYKHWETLNLIFDALLQHRCERKTTLIALGGGVVGDMTGFAASVYLRGVPFIQIPTTLLSQVDSSVGGKTGINHPLGKNMLGAFYQPEVVLIDTTTLLTLPDRELSAGLAEVIKYGLIRDVDFLHWLDENMPALLNKQMDALTYAIVQSCQHKAEVVAADEKETGVRAHLNLGHTFGHAIETGMGYGVWLHGEAVAAGTVLAAQLSAKLGWLSPDEVQFVEKLFSRANLPILAPALGENRYMELMQQDKKVESGHIRFVLLQGLGAALVTRVADVALVQSVLP